MEKENPRALNLEKLETVKNKTTLGFKCEPRLKLRLAQEAQKLSITLSEYVEGIVANYNPAVNNTEQSSSLLKAAKAKVDFYENDILKELFAANKGKTFDFITAKGESLNVKINTLQDVYTVLINSFKTSK